MCEIQNSTKPDSRSVIISHSKYLEEDNGWQTNIGSNAEREWSKEYNFKIIKLANKQSSLLQSLSNKNIKFEINYSTSGWTHKSCCPFPDHQDKTPSFHYNSSDDIFKCHGCGRVGGNVEFLSFLTGKKKTEVAKSILDKENITSDIYDSIYEDIDDRFDVLMKQASDCARSFLRKNNEKKHLSIIEKLFWNIDLYIEKYFGTDMYSSDDLQVRINYIKERLEEYEQQSNSR